jgi:PTH1 family peptidyl-tRNA hydrolase
VSRLKLIIGLGNPGKTYQHTRHNFGFLTVTDLARRNGLKFKRSLLCKSFIARGTIEGKPVELAMPLSFMNASGWVVKKLALKHKLDLKDILVVCDDVNLKLGDLRIRPSGSDGGHNGLKSIIEHLKTRDFPRLRLGIGRERKEADLVEFVLSEFRRDEAAAVASQVEAAGDCCMEWIRSGITKTMDRFNKGK